MKITIDTLKLNLDKYSKNILLRSLNDKEIENMKRAIKNEWIDQGGLVYNFDYYSRSIIENRYNYNNSHEELTPILVICKNELDFSLLVKWQERANVQILMYTNDRNYTLPNIAYTLDNSIERYWSHNGTLHKVPLVYREEAIVC